MVSVKNLKSSLVTPSVPPPYPFSTLHSSKLDIVIANIYVKTVYFFKANGMKDFFSSHVLIRALSEALSHFYPMAGRVTADLDIVCNGDGALFVEAEADCTVDDLGSFKPDPQLLKLVPILDSSQDVTNQPLVIIQVTRFQCGGVALGVGVEHHVADGVSALSFLNSWSDIARGETFTGCPSFDKSWLKARNPPMPHFVHDEYLKLPQPPSRQDKTLPVGNHSSSQMETSEVTGDRTIVNGVLAFASEYEDHATEALDDHSKVSGIPLKRAMSEELEMVSLKKLSKGLILESCTVRQKMNRGCQSCVVSAQEQDCCAGLEELEQVEPRTSEGIVVYNESLRSESLPNHKTEARVPRNCTGTLSSALKSEHTDTQQLSLINEVIRQEHSRAGTDPVSGTWNDKGPGGASSTLTLNGDGAYGIVSAKLALSKDRADSMVNWKLTPNSDHESMSEMYCKVVEDKHGKSAKQPSYNNENTKQQSEEVCGTYNEEQKHTILLNRRQESGTPNEGEEAIVSMFELPKDLLRKLKNAGEGTLSTYELLAAHVWKCCCEARDLGSKEESMLVMAVDGRARLKGASIPKHYIGNAVFNCCPVLPAGEVRQESVSAIADRIHAAIKRMDDTYCRSAIDFLELCPRAQLAGFVKGPHTFRSPNMGFISWNKFPFYDCDFGWGRPVHVGPAHMPWEGHAYVLPSPPHSTSAGSLCLCITLQRRHVHKFSHLLYHTRV